MAESRSSRLRLSLVGFALLLAAGCVRSGPPAEVVLHGYVPPDPPPLPTHKPLPPRQTPVSVALQPTAAKTVSKRTPERISPRYAAPVRVAELDTRRYETRTQIAAATGSRGVHTVERGDTVYRIARAYDVPIRGLLDANRLQPPYQLTMGQRLVIPQPRRHTVRAGDTVYGVSRRYAVDMAELVRLNSVGPPYRLRPGQRLFLPQPTGQATMVAAAARPESTTPVARRDRVFPPLNNGEVELAPETVEPVAPTLAAIPEPPPRAGSKFFWPVNGQVIAAFGPQIGGLHNDGINIAAPRGALVHAADNGVVAYAGSELRGFGNLVLLKHADGWTTAYAHNDELLVRRGDTVKRNQPIARVGSSGNVSSPQLHFEIREGTRAIDPTQLLGPLQAQKG